MDNILKQYTDLYASCSARIQEGLPKVMNDLRGAALDALQKKGLPTTALEEYKYNDISQLFAPDYGLNITRIKEFVNEEDIFSCDVPNMGTSVFFVLNDSVHTGNLQDSRKGLPEGVFVGPARAFALSHPSVLETYYGKLADPGSDGVTAINTLLAQDALIIYVPRNVSVTKPLQIVNVLQSLRARMANRRVLIILEDGASVRILSCDHTMDGTDYLATQVIEAYVGNNAHLELYELEENGPSCHRISNLYISQEASSHVRHNQISLSGGFTRNATSVWMKGEGADLSLYGMAIADSTQVVDNRTFVHHMVPHCKSDQLYKYVLDDSARGAFSGLVKVEKDAHHTSSTQTNRNLCATREAHMFTQPQLEIYNDDVKCSHGAAVGQLDQNALFYMQQRGLPLKEARMLLMFAFVGEVVDNIPLEALKSRLHYLVEKRFRGELNKSCAACKMCRGK